MFGSKKLVSSSIFSQIYVILPLSVIMWLSVNHKWSELWRQCSTTFPVQIQDISWSQWPCKYPDLTKMIYLRGGKFNESRIPNELPWYQITFTDRTSMTRSDQNDMLYSPPPCLSSHTSVEVSNSQPCSQ